MNKALIWKFPANVDISLVSRYLSVFNTMQNHHRIVFDMNDIEDIHSSFIGFLIFSKEKLKKSGGEIIFQMSPYLRNMLTRLGMAEYFAI
ncbi:MAG: hypothetical protein JW807_10840 [Spirochaetes bacterium]|nr:hypothetical protein [Spirochaetota bacterium]